MNTTSPVSQSSSLFRQQSPQPSHRLSHSVLLICASDFVFQKGASLIVNISVPFCSIGRQRDPRLPYRNLPDYEIIAKSGRVVVMVE